MGITINKRILEKKIQSIKKNFFEVQDEASQIVSILSGAESEMKVLDYCAGKGTKTLALYDQMKGKGDIYVYDIDENRLKLLKKRFHLLNINNKVTIFNGNKGLENYFDVILLDVPCTGSGIWRRRPETMIRLNLTEYKKNLKIQHELLNKVAKYCKKNGIISYITCSIFQDENENQIKRKLELFNICEDPFETDDISEKQIDKVNQLESKINKELNLDYLDVRNDLDRYFDPLYN